MVKIVTTQCEQWAGHADMEDVGWKIFGYSFGREERLGMVVGEILFYGRNGI